MTTRSRKLTSAADEPGTKVIITIIDKRGWFPPSSFLCIINSDAFLHLHVNRKQFSKEIR